MVMVFGEGVTPGDVPGTIIPFGGSVPSGYLECDGSAVSRTTYARLFNIIGTTYGVGDGSTTFNVPDLRGRDVIGDGQGSGLTNRSRGDTGGEESHTITDAEMGYHYHQANAAGFITYNSGTRKVEGVGAANVNKQTHGYTDYSGSNSAHNTMHPFGVAKFLIKT